MGLVGLSTLPRPFRRTKITKSENLLPTRNRKKAEFYISPP